MVPKNGDKPETATRLVLNDTPSTKEAAPTTGVKELLQRVIELEQKTERMEKHLRELKGLVADQQRSKGFY